MTFPDGTKKRGSSAAGDDGHYARSFRQPGGHTTGSKRTAKVLVTVTHGSDTPVQARGSYTIR